MYTRESPLRGTGTVSAEAIQAWFISRGPAYKGYAPDGQYQPPPAGLGAAIVAECRRYPDQPVNHDLLAGQILHETAAWQSEYARERNNPGGIGAINSDPDQALWFATAAEGVRAHVAHMLNYVYGKGAWSLSDPRGLPEGFYGVVDVLWHLEQRWAWTPPAKYAATPVDQRYGAQLAKHANALVTFANDGSWPMAGDDPRFAWVPDTSEFGYPQGRHGRNGKPIDYLIVHVTEGTDSLGWLNGNNGSSAHYLTHRDATPRAQMVREADAAWTAGNRDYNERGINVEFERFARDAWTGQEYKHAAATCYPMLKRHNIPLVYLGRNNASKRGLIGHEHVPDPDGSGWGGNGNHTDPGPQFDWARFMAELRALDGSTPPTPPADDRILAVGNPHGDYGYRLGFKGRLQQIGAAVSPNDVNAGILAWAGWAKEDEWAGVDGCTYQRTERLILKYEPGVAVPFDIVARLRATDALPERKT